MKTNEPSKTDQEIARALEATLDRLIECEEVSLRDGEYYWSGNGETIIHSSAITKSKRVSPSIDKVLTVANSHNYLKSLHPCPWLKFEGRAGTFEYAKNVYEWMEHEFGFGRHCICDDSGWWYVEERSPVSVGGQSGQ